MTEIKYGDDIDIFDYLPSSSQLGWFGSQFAPGAGTIDAAGGMPGPPTGEQSAFAAEHMPSMAENLQQGGWGYLDAGLQGLGVLGDATWAAGPLVGATVGSALKGVGAAGKALRGIASLDKVNKVNELIQQGKVSAGGASKTEKLINPTTIDKGKLVDVRRNLGTSVNDPQLEKFAVQTIHDVKILKGGKVSNAESGIGSGPALSYDSAVTVKSDGVPIELKVNQTARDQIVSRTKPKFPMAAVRGRLDDIDVFEPDEVLGFNPMKNNVFVDRQGYGIKSIKNGRATVVDTDVLVKLDSPDNFKIIKDADGKDIKLYDDIEYYDANTIPTTKNPSEVNVLPTPSKGIASLDKVITGLHGSPTKFDRFDLSKRPLDEFGMPKGLDRYGAGFYFTGRNIKGKKIAAEYAGPEGFVYKVEIPKDKLLDMTTDLSGQPAGLRKELEKILPEDFVKTNPSAREIAGYFHSGPNEKMFRSPDGVKHAEWDSPRKLPYGGKYLGGDNSSGVNFVVADDSIINIVKTSSKDGNRGIASLDVPTPPRLGAEALPASVSQAPQQLIDVGGKPLSRFFTEPEIAKLKNTQSAASFMALTKALPEAREMATVAEAGAAKRGWYQASAHALQNVFGQDAPRFAGVLAATSPQSSVESNLLNASNIFKNWNAAGRPSDPRLFNIINEPGAAGALALKKRVGIKTVRISEAEARRIFIAAGGDDGLFDMGRMQLQIIGNSVEGERGIESILDAWVSNTVRSLNVPDNQMADLVLSGPKVDSFMRNLVGNTIEVTNDTWVANYLGIPQTSFGGSLNPARTDPGKGAGYIAANVLTRKAADILSNRLGEIVTGPEVQEMVWSWSKAVFERARSEGMSPTDFIKQGRLTDSMINDTPDFSRLLNDPDLPYRNILKDDFNVGDPLPARLAEGNVTQEIMSRSDTLRRDLQRATGRLQQIKMDKAALAAVAPLIVLSMVQQGKEHEEPSELFGGGPVEIKDGGAIQRIKDFFAEQSQYQQAI